MTRLQMSIKPLPPDVVAQISSSITITSLNKVICELIMNSLDAGATKLDVSVDYSRGGCTVEDDGFGILPLEFGPDGHLGKLHHSSKYHSQSPVHGGKGVFLAALSALAVLSITSHHHSHRSHNALTMHKSEIVSRQIPAPPEQYITSTAHGTRVSVRDLFGNIPVRVKQRIHLAEKQRGHVRDWEELKRGIISLLLAWPTIVSLVLRESESNYKIVIRPPASTSGPKISRDLVYSILSQASFIPHDEKDSWVRVGASTLNLRISGFLSLQPNATKNVQFLSLDIRPLMASDGHNVFYDEVNNLFSNSAFGADKEIERLDRAEGERSERDNRYRGARYTNKDLRGTKKGVDRWPMFCIGIQLLEAGTSQIQFNDVLIDKGPTVSMVMELLQTMILEFLTKHHFCPKAPRSKRLRGLKNPNCPPLPGNGGHSSRANQITDHSTPQRRKSRLKTETPPDALGTNVTMPSFRQGRIARDSPFGTWSRIKQGATVSRSPTPKEDIGLLASYQITRPSTIPPRARTVPASERSRSGLDSLKPFRPLVSTDGKIIRAPFDDVIVFQPRRGPPSQASSLNPHIRPSCDHYQSADPNDDIVVYINPITKVKSLINQRTGLTMNSDRVLSRNRVSQLSLEPTRTISMIERPSPWLEDLLNKWDNPVFQTTEPSIPQVVLEGHAATTQHILHGRRHHCSQIDIERAFKESSSGIGERISKDALARAEVISQVDKKFILVKFRNHTSPAQDDDDSMLVLIDQHAADERIRVEALMQELCAVPSSAEPGTDPASKILTTHLENPLDFEIPSKEIKVLDLHRAHFANWGILYTLLAHEPKSTTQRVTVSSLPPGILERCKLDPRLLVDLIRNEVHKFPCSPPSPNHSPLSSGPGDWIRRIHGCPQGILDMLNSRACRSAIMFNDVLTKRQCEAVVERLSRCRFPFVCAHGRPSLVPIVGVGGLRLGVGGDGSCGAGVIDGKKVEGGFGKAFRRWTESIS
ncbi:hypothetical protein BUE80_DR013149 [Diplocarpon rosae]|nr:hypothetical protein BUE80_DR013149 [Diplocarpon rosae]